MTRERLMKDHAIPVAVLRDILFEQQPRNIEELREFLLRYYRFGVITQGEDLALNKAGLRSRMPDGWTPGDSAFDRYAKVGIIAQDHGLSLQQVPLPTPLVSQAKRVGALAHLRSSVASPSNGKDRG